MVRPDVRANGAIGGLKISSGKNSENNPLYAVLIYSTKRDNETEVKRASRLVEVGGGIPAIMWHWGQAPASEKVMKTVKRMLILINALSKDTKEYTAHFGRGGKRKQIYRRKIRDVKICLYWHGESYHELNVVIGFGERKQGNERFKKLWITMYNYFVHDRGLNNLIWVLCYRAVRMPTGFREMLMKTHYRRGYLRWW